MKRDAKSYTVEKTLHTLLVLEALEGSLKEPLSIRRVVDRTKLPYDAVRRILLTCKFKNWAAQNEKGEWMIGSKVMRFGENFNDVILNAVAP